MAADIFKQQLVSLTRMAREAGLHEAADWLLEQCVDGDTDPSAFDGSGPQRRDNIPENL